MENYANLLFKFIFFKKVSFSDKRMALQNSNFICFVDELDFYDQFYAKMFFLHIPSLL